MAGSAECKSLRLKCALEGVSCSVLPQQLTLVADFAQQALARPTLPAMLTFPAVALKSSLPIELDIHVGMISGQLHSSTNCTPANARLHEGVAGHVRDLSCQVKIHITWDPGTGMDGLGFPSHPSVLALHIQLSADDLEANALAHDASQGLVLIPMLSARQPEPGQPAASLQLQSRTGGPHRGMQQATIVLGSISINIAPGALRQCIVLASLVPATRSDNASNEAIGRGGPGAELRLRMTTSRLSATLQSAPVHAAMLQLGTSDVDDLRCGLFEILPHATQSPGPMQISWGQEAASLWSSTAEAWLSWCYPHPRHVAAACFLPTDPGLTGIEFHLAACLPGQDSFSRVPVQLAAGMQPGVMMTAQEPPAAKLWQLRWCMAKKDMDKASLVARCLHINADLASVQSTPAPLAARISLSLQAESLSLSLLVPGPTPHVNAAASPKELLSLKLDNVQASVQAWKGGKLSLLDEVMAAVTTATETYSEPRPCPHIFGTSLAIRTSSGPLLVTATATSHCLLGSGGADMWAPARRLAITPTPGNITWPGGLTGLVAVSVQQVGLQTQVTVRPGHAVANATERHLQLCYVGPLADPAASSFADTGSTPQPGAGFLRSEVMLDLGPGQGHKDSRAGELCEILVLGTQSQAAGPHGTLHVWLGGGGGWSLPLPLHAPYSQGVSAGGFSRDAPASPFTQEADMPQLLCRVRPDSQATGQTLLELWPAMLLLNWLPMPLEWRLCEATISPGGSLPGEEALIAHSGQAGAGESCGIDATLDRNQAVGFRLLEQWAPEAPAAPSTGSEPAAQQVQPKHKRKQSWSWQSPAETIEEPIHAQGWSQWLLSLAPGSMPSASADVDSRVKGAPMPAIGSTCDLALQLNGQLLSCTAACSAPDEDVPALRLSIALQQGDAQLVDFRAETTRAQKGSQRHACAWTTACVRITAASAPGTDVASGPHSMAIHIEPGMHATNLTPWPLEVTPEPVVEPGSSVTLQPGCTSSLQHVCRRHLVVFVDAQPPLAVFNALSTPLEVGSFLTSDADISEQAMVTHVVAPLATLECEAGTEMPVLFSPSRPLGDQDGEDEDAFLRAVTSGSHAAQPDSSLKVRLLGQTAWSPAVGLRPGDWQAGEFQLNIQQQAATMRVAVSSKAAGDGSFEEIIKAAQFPSKLAFSLHLAELQVSFWDDERHLWRGPAPVPASGPIQHSAAAELGCIHVKGITAQLCRTSSTMPGAEEARAAQLAYALTADIAALQIDSFLEATNYPVVCLTIPRSLSASARAPTPLVALQVRQSLQAGRGASLSNTWPGNQSPPWHQQQQAILQTGFITSEQAEQSSPSAQLRESVDAQLIESAARAAAGAAAKAPHSSDEVLLAEAAAAAGSRLLVERLEVGALQLLCEVHLSGSIGGLPFAVDTHRAPVSLPPLRARGLLFRAAVMLRALAAHLAAEALLNAPRVLGSLELLFNPTGLLTSASQGLQDLFALPLAALEARSAAQFATGLGLGGASLLRHLSSWTLTSVSGFSGAVASVLQRSLAADASARALAVRQPAPTQLGQGLSRGLTGLAGSLAAGVSGIVAAPVAAYNDGSGVLVGTGRGLLGAVGLPLSGALDLVSSLSSALASSTGIAPTSAIRRGPLPPGLLQGRLFLPGWSLQGLSCLRNSAAAG
ncbi:hypothetical protein WJX73_010837 [Symbiochloris irregularis]|uniref:Vacuolar protein sorting-associated protein 13 DH-like domain-containing protein n=1 Tax=Symbiochloris irregularis TaxID=706552 RepID=A0AAW1PPJ5_9CHLO